MGGGNVNGGPGTTTYDWIYGDEGDDLIFGEHTSTTQNLFGGSGHDYIRGGDTSGTSQIWGGEGDDFIRTGGSISTKVTVKAGKGDDTIGEVHWDGTNFGTNRRYADGPSFESVIF